jgi:hypothetical protein
MVCGRPKRLVMELDSWRPEFSSAQAQFEVLLPYNEL